MWRRLVTLWLSAALAACGATPDPPPSDTHETVTASVPSPPSAVTTATASTAPTSAGSPVGNWFSPSCASRTYDQLTLAQDGTFASSDRVSPCPPHAQCVWSGFAMRSGTWKLEGTSVTLTTNPDAKDRPAGKPLATSLTFDGNAIAEGTGAERCVYAKR